MTDPKKSGGPNCPTARATTRTPTTPKSSDASEYIAGMRQRRAASNRMTRLDCGCVDPWACRHSDSEQSDRSVDGYRDAARHLLAHGFTPAPDVPAMRVMWRRGGTEQRLARRIAEGWEVAA